MSHLRFSWDQRKSRTNHRKHGVTFEEAQTAFLDENGRRKSDVDHSEQEDREILVGFGARFRLLTIVFVFRGDEEVIHIISARRSSRSETAHYMEHL